jgi:ATP-dependent protease HslVU (ClpYQ) peptidase subunit
MTTLVAVQTADDVLLGWDSARSFGNEVMQLAHPKVWVSDGLIYGVSGSARFSDIMYATNFPEYDGSEPRKWLIRELVPAILRNVEASGHEAMIRDETGLISAGIFVVVDGTVYAFDGALSPTATTDGIYTTGSGGDYAKGALKHGATIYEAIEIACEVDPHSGGEIHIASANHMIATEVLEFA